MTHYEVATSSLPCRSCGFSHNDLTAALNTSWRGTWLGLYSVQSAYEGFYTESSYMPSWVLGDELKVYIPASEVSFLCTIIYFQWRHFVWMHCKSLNKLMLMISCQTAIWDCLSMQMTRLMTALAWANRPILAPVCLLLTRATEWLALCPDRQVMFKKMAKYDGKRKFQLEVTLIHAAYVIFFWCYLIVLAICFSRDQVREKLRSENRGRTTNCLVITCLLSY